MPSARPGPTAPATGASGRADRCTRCRIPRGASTFSSRLPLHSASSRPGRRKARRGACRSSRQPRLRLIRLLGRLADPRSLQAPPAPPPGGPQLAERPLRPHATPPAQVHRGFTHVEPVVRISSANRRSRLFFRIGYPFEPVPTAGSLSRSPPNVVSIARLTPRLRTLAGRALERRLRLIPFGFIRGRPESGPAGGFRPAFSGREESRKRTLLAAGVEKALRSPKRRTGSQQAVCFSGRRNRTSSSSSSSS